jgi:Ser/Thr protein kinase RdoA (MazF antagonist)
MTEMTPEAQRQLFHALATAACARWPFEVARLEPLKVRENAVFAAHLHDGTRVVVRVHRLGYHNDAELHSEQIWMAALQAARIAAPRPIASRTGRPFELVAADAGQPRQVDVFEWVDGRQLGSVENGLSDSGDSIEATYASIGEIAARIHNQASAWELPAGFCRHAWDAAGLAGEQPFWGRFWELEALSASQRQLFLRVKDSVFADLTAFGTGPDRYSMIHADLVPENVLTTCDGLQIIDFDDAGFGWHLFELATSLYFIRREPYYSQALQGLVAGYSRERLLPESHLKLLPLFLAARGTTYLGWVHTRKAEPVAQELTPMLIGLAESAAEDYLNSR